MEIVELTQKEFDSIFTKTGYIFSKSDFNELNRYKVDELVYLGFKEKKYRLGVCFGKDAGSLLAPFSAPYAMFVKTKDKVDVQYIYQAVEKLDEYCKKERIQNIKFVMPPVAFEERDVSVFINAFANHRYQVEHTDLNYHLDLRKVYSDNYSSYLPHNGRKNLKIALQSGLELMLCANMEQKREAYNIIKVNRENKNRPLRMEFQQILDTIQIVKADIFQVKNGEEGIAAAFVFWINEKLVRVIYWGDTPGYSEKKPINFLAYQLIQYYGKLGVEIIDIGISTENSIPNIGLCDFKESIGCDVSLAYTISKRYN
jgi:hypothetical protein